MTQVWQPNYSTNARQSYQNLLCMEYRMAQMGADAPPSAVLDDPRPEAGIADPEISDHVALLVAQLQDANRRILALEAQLAAETVKTQQICRAAAQMPVVAPEASQEAFPANALRWSV